MLFRSSLTDTGLFDWTRYPNIADYYKRFAPTHWGMAQLRAKALRDFGGALGPEAAHHLSVGSETMALRIERESASALALARMLSADDRVAAAMAAHVDAQHSEPGSEQRGNLLAPHAAVRRKRVGKADHLSALGPHQVVIQTSSCQWQQHRRFLSD